MEDRVLQVLLTTKRMVYCRRIPYTVALRHKNRACAALLNSSAAEPLVWPSPLKLISELNPEAKALLERALMEANMEREKAILKETVYSDPSSLNYDVEADDNASEVILCIFFFFFFSPPSFQLILITPYFKSISNASLCRFVFLQGLYVRMIEHYQIE